MIESALNKLNHKSNILIVDDDPFVRQSLKLILKSDTINVFYAEEANQAKSILSQNGINSFQCVVTDYAMPGENGTELLSWIHQNDPSLSTIMLSSNEERDVLKQSYSLGIFDFINKKSDPSEIIDSVYKAILKTNRKREIKSIQQEISQVRTIHKKFEENFTKSILSQNSPFNIHTYLAPAANLGGDFVNSFKINDHKILIIAGDISGHNIKSGFISAFFQGLIKGMLINNVFSIEKIAKDFNDFLLNEWNKSIDITSISTCFLTVDIKEKKIQVLTNGLPPPKLLNQGQFIQRISNGSPPLGWFSSDSITVEEYDITDSGSCYIWSDGIIDFSKLFNVSPFTIAYILQDPSVSEDDRNKIIQNRNDDILTVKIAWNEDDIEFHPILADKYPGNYLDNISQLNKKWRLSLELALPSLKSNQIHDILLVTQEIVVNGILHGCKKDPNKYTFLSFFVNKDKSTLKIIVTDQGTGYNVSTINDNPIDFDINNTESFKHTSMGLKIASQFSDEFHREKNGTVNILKFNITPT